jgi:hypothetical protein
MNTSKTPPDGKTSYATAFFDSIDPDRISGNTSMSETPTNGTQFLSWVNNLPLKFGGHVWLLRYSLSAASRLQLQLEL